VNTPEEQPSPDEALARAHAARAKMAAALNEDQEPEPDEVSAEAPETLKAPKATAEDRPGPAPRPPPPRPDTCAFVPEIPNDDLGWQPLWKRPRKPKSKVAKKQELCKQRKRLQDAGRRRLAAGQSRRPRSRQNRIGNAAARRDARALSRVRHSNAWLW